MTETLLDAVSPVTVTAFARDIAAETDGGLARFLPNRSIEGYKTRTTKVSRTTTAAKLRSFDAETPIGKRNVLGVVKQLDLQPVGQKLPLREKELIDFALRTGDWASIVTAVYDDTETNVANIRNLVEIMRARYLFSGAVDLNQDGIQMTADFDLPGNHNISLGSITPWDNPGADPIADELLWSQVVTEDSGESPIAMIGSAAVRNALLRSDAYIGALGTLKTSITIAEFNAVREAYELPPFFVYDEKVAGNRLTPAAKVALVTSTVGETQWGVTAEELELVGSNAVDEISQNTPRIVASAWKSQDPVMIWSKANATVLPVAGDINGLLVAEVLAGGGAS